MSVAVAAEFRSLSFGIKEIMVASEPQIATAAAVDFFFNLISNKTDS